ncbi:hypothetical protein TUN199_04405 [Pyrenophora tritici-repentis]|uniref:Uncharacterized protein n=1 Tax=Pyrenophora tritici-repentis TaxID=45151 RepID=A0A834S282_9PLEO|nr:hypothetical protein PtrM4_062570 [Pyrenophora tritici-repentis]KAI0577019.1 hypothetical protein Alg130_08554 [Pyrenophora tritici-repentis]KAI0580780.1 hypothetical protein Alg215_05044 [Pyrenophora tritici-repentis]KAI0604945.1 hypothetical protein TUN205_10812 [Pyrenophora tritici-repentis]KAI0623612.1 hypothetical protein TUN199_04405 [Pyrenophora tritici-repentis]
MKAVFAFTILTALSQNALAQSCIPDGDIGPSPPKRQLLRWLRME